MQAPILSHVHADCITGLHTSRRFAPAARDHQAIKSISQPLLTFLSCLPTRPPHAAFGPSVPSASCSQSLCVVAAGDGAAATPAPAAAAPSSGPAPMDEDVLLQQALAMSMEVSFSVQCWPAQMWHARWQTKLSRHEESHEAQRCCSPVGRGPDDGHAGRRVSQAMPVSGSLLAMQSCRHSAGI